MKMSVSKGWSSPKNHVECRADYSALWISRGSAVHNGNVIYCGAGVLLRRGERVSITGSDPCHWVRFDLSRNEVAHDALSSSDVVLPELQRNGSILLRLDQVTFPPRGVAYRHIHSGAGYRYLVEGSLKVIGDTAEEVAYQGHAWFEGANSPVRAEASADFETTSFVRFMVLPAVFLGKPTIEILDPEERRLPRVQTTKRHTESLVYFAPG